MTDGQLTYESARQAYRELFEPMSSSARTLWFFAADESAVLSFDVLPDETINQAGTRHGLKLLAMAEALQSLPGAEAQQAIVASLRLRISAHRGRRFRLMVDGISA